MAELTGPDRCAECGLAFTDESILAGRSMPAAVTIRKHHIGIPGLYWCMPCGMAVMSGATESSITVEAANAFLRDIYAPAMLISMLAPGSPEEAYRCAGCLEKCMEVQTVLEAVILLKDEPGGLDFIPECNGHCGVDHQGQEKELAHLS